MLLVRFEDFVTFESVLVTERNAADWAVMLREGFSGPVHRLLVTVPVLFR